MRASDHRILPAMMVLSTALAITGCQREAPTATVPDPASAAAAPAEVAAPAADAADVSATSPSATQTDAEAVTATPAPMPIRALREKETERVRADALGQSAILACKLLPESRIKARERARREDLLAQGVDPKAYDAVYRQFYERVETRYPTAKPEIQVQVCEQARKFARSAFGEDAISATDRL